jgi:tetratricopeptide (TPR) repeat protein
MKLALLWLGILLVAGFFATTHAFAGPCDAAQPQFKEISRKLDHSDFAAAARLLAPVANSFPECPLVLLAQARTQAAQGDSAQADNSFARYVTAQPDDASGYAYYARFLLSQRQYQHADILSSIAIEKDHTVSIALAVGGQILFMKGQTNQGLSMLAKACRLNPEDAESQFEIGSIYDRIKHPADAVKHFSRAVDLNPHDARAFDYLALNLEPLGEINRAELAYKKAFSANRSGLFYDGFLDYNYGRFLAKRGDFAASKIHLDRAVELVPDVRATWYERAKLNLKMKSYLQARSDAERAESLSDPAGIIIDLQIYALLEQIYRHLGETGLADKYAQLSRNTPPPTRKQ